MLRTCLVNSSLAAGTGSKIQQAEQGVDSVIRGDVKPAYELSGSLLLALALISPRPLRSQQSAAKQPMPWQDKTLSADTRADLVLKALTLDQKIQLMHGTGDPYVGAADPRAGEGIGGSGYVPGFPELGIPGMQMDDSAYGVAYSAGSGRYSTALPSNLGLAASWDPALAKRYGALIGSELRDQGFNMTLGGGVNLTREPRNGRTFEYMGGDPLLAGTMVGNLIQGVQSTHVLGDIKHFAVNDQESGRHAVSSEIDERAMRETDLLAFQIGIEIGQPAAVMCAYNRVNGEYACENDFLLKKVLRDDWHFRGFVVSDWLATHSTVKASHAGLDQEEPGNFFFGPAMKVAVKKGYVSTAELNEHVHRILRSMFASGVVDDPPTKQVPRVFEHAEIAREIETKSLVLLRNESGLLPLDADAIHTIAVIGRNADKGMISGGGSAQVDPPGGNAIGSIPEKERKADWQKAVWFPDAPLSAIQAAAPGAQVLFQDGENIEAAAAVARKADVVLLFAYQWQAEGIDLPTLALPDGQNELIQAVSKGNPHIVVVLETGGPVLMPWKDQVQAVVESWYSGTSGNHAVADVLFGKVDPSGKLPITFPLADRDLPHPVLVTPPPASAEDWTDSDAMSRRLLTGLPPFSVSYDEGLEVDYKWYEAEHKQVLFPFGFGLSYTSFTYTDVHVDQHGTLSVRFTLENTGKRSGEEIAQVYATLPASTGEPAKRLVGWSKVPLRPGEQKQVTIPIPQRNLATWDMGRHSWLVPSGDFTLSVGSSSQELPLQVKLSLSGDALPAAR